MINSIYTLPIAILSSTYTELSTTIPNSKHLSNLKPLNFNYTFNKSTKPLDPINLLEKAWLARLASKICAIFLAASGVGFFSKKSSTLSNISFEENPPHEYVMTPLQQRGTSLLEHVLDAGQVGREEVKREMSRLQTTRPHSIDGVEEVLQLDVPRQGPLQDLALLLHGRDPAQR